MNIEAVILYSTNDYRFFSTCIKNLVAAGVKCHIITYSHMWNGTPEDENLLQESVEQFKDHSAVKFYRIDWQTGQHPWYWEAAGRYLATQEISQECEYIMYIDIDEIIDIDRFTDWIKTEEYKKYDCIKLAGYWYWREPVYRSGPEYNTVMTVASLAKQLPLVSGGREVYFTCSPNQHRTDINRPLLDHYSWVRTKEQMLHKVQNWGHASDRTDWQHRVEEEFSRPFNGKTFINDYTFEVVENRYDL